MPEIEFLGNELDSQYLHSIMVYPNDDLAQGRLLAATGCHYLTECKSDSSDITISSALMKQLAHTDAYGTEVGKASLNASHGLIAGDVLVCLAKMSLANHLEPSMRKAKALVKHYYDDATNVNGLAAPSSPQKINQYMTDFKSVIHLWAAFRICATPNTDNYLENFNIHVPATMSKFLSIADWFRQFAESQMPSRQPTRLDTLVPYFSTGVLYTFGNSYLVDQPAISWAEMDEWMIGVLREYSAK